MLVHLVVGTKASRAANSDVSRKRTVLFLLFVRETQRGEQQMHLNKSCHYITGNGENTRMFLLRERRFILVNLHLEIKTTENLVDSKKKKN